MLPRHLDGLFPIVSQDNELRRSAVVVRAEAHDVYLSHSGRKIAQKCGGEQGGVGSGLGLLSYLAPRSRPVICRACDTGRDRAKKPAEPRQISVEYNGDC
jgi:hypothetical protein